MTSDRLSTPLRDLLIEHIDGAVPLRGPVKRGGGITVTDRNDFALRQRSVLTAMARGYIVFDRKVSPTETRMTDKGREVLCAELAWMADVLTRAGWNQSGGFLPDEPVSQEKSVNIG